MTWTRSVPPEAAEEPLKSVYERIRAFAGRGKVSRLWQSLGQLCERSTDLDPVRGRRYQLVQIEGGRLPVAGGHGGELIRSTCRCGARSV